MLYYIKTYNRLIGYIIYYILYRLLFNIVCPNSDFYLQFFLHISIIYLLNS